MFLRHQGKKTTVVQDFRGQILNRQRSGTGKRGLPPTINYHDQPVRLIVVGLTYRET